MIKFYGNAAIAAMFMKALKHRKYAPHVFIPERILKYLLKHIRKIPGTIHMVPGKPQSQPRGISNPKKIRLSKYLI